MNELEQYIADHGLNAVDTMNKLQDASIISDNAVLAEDVNETDAARAIEFLKEHP